MTAERSSSSRRGSGRARPKRRGAISRAAPACPSPSVSPLAAPGRRRRSACWPGDRSPETILRSPRRVSFRPPWEAVSSPGLSCRSFRGRRAAGGRRPRRRVPPRGPDPYKPDGDPMRGGEPHRGGRGAGHGLSDLICVMVTIPNRTQICPNPAKPGQPRAKKIKEKGLDFLGFPCQF